jgi:methionyl aminopeptidase
VIQLKSAREIDLMAQGGKILSATLEMLRVAVRPGVSTGELDQVAEDFIRASRARRRRSGIVWLPWQHLRVRQPEIVHGIPSKKRVLREGDIISLDVGVGYKGYFTDSALTVPVGAVKPTTQRLLDVTESLEAGIAVATVGNHIGDIGAAVQAVVEAAGFSIVRDLVGHGIEVGFREEPQGPELWPAQAGARSSCRG